MLEVITNRRKKTLTLGHYFDKWILQFFLFFFFFFPYGTKFKIEYCRTGACVCGDSQAINKQLYRPYVGHFFNMASIQVETTMTKNHEKGTFINCHEHV